MSNKSKRTPLYDSHIERGAKMGNFGGYDMPLWYSTGPKDEHLSVVRSAGIFDTSHMVAISVKGEGAFELLQKCYSKDLNACIGPKRKPLENGKCVYGVFLKEDGCVIDDAIVYRLDEKHFTVIVNAGMGEPVARHLLENRGSCPAEITDLTDKLGKIDVQGPQAARIVEKVIRSPKIVFEKLPYFNFKGYYGETLLGTGEVRLLDGIPILLSRTGYTGEFGFEIFVEGDHTLTLWNRLLEAGEPFGALACGLAARDSLRAGAVLPLSHQDIGDWPFAENPWLFALPIGDETSAFTKDFIGGEALRQLK
ncbi:MAG: aminomethyl transferase family protein, partial [Proteobacteria bacterium]|nr:aminomethyl transferase family protein [Pseudomonadota bacterium]